jgi:acyl carrier protein
MNRTETAEKVIRLVIAALPQAAELAIEEASSLADLNADSLDRVEIVMDCEEAFRIEISDAEAEEVQTVGQLIALVEKLQAADA